ncbi:hypothetical protein H8356DRAFT_1642053 [Neocallimastix lanati (nom. inval.)]|nr:hypothetical protein H8356DRAFT_1642053 [Neocallimastix sp. JGI-2020a]
MNTKITNEFSVIIKQYDKLNEEISNVHSNTSEETININNSKISNYPNSTLNDNLNLTQVPSESLLMDMTFWSTSDDDYSFEQNSNLQKKNSNKIYSENIDKVSANHNINIMSKDSSNSNKNNILNSHMSDTNSNKASINTNSGSNNNIVLLKNMFSKIIKQKNIV